MWFLKATVWLCRTIACYKIFVVKLSICHTFECPHSPALYPHITITRQSSLGGQVVLPARYHSYMSWLHIFGLMKKLRKIQNKTFFFLFLFLVIILYQDLIYSEILSGRLGAWLVNKIRCICMQSQNFKKDLILKFKTISRRCFIFMIAWMV